MNRTGKLRGEERKLLVSFSAPHARISRDTLSRWTLVVLNKAVVDTKKYARNSTRGRQLYDDFTEDNTLCCRE